MKKLFNFPKYSIHYRKLGYSLVTLLILGCSIFSSISTQLDPQINYSSLNTEGILEELNDYDQASMEAYNHFVSQWDPQELSYEIPTEDLPNFKDSYKGIYFDKWLEENLESETVVFQEDDKYVTLEKSYGDDWEQIVLTEIVGRNQITLIEPDFSGIDNITVPVKSRVESASVAKGTTVVQKTVKIGMDISLPRFSKSIRRNVGPMQIYAWARCIIRFHFVFPVLLTIEFPNEVIEGAAYSLKCSLTPLDLPSYNEFEIKIEISVGMEIRAKIPQVYWKTKKIKIGWKKIKIKYPAMGMKWKTLIGGSVGYTKHIASSYRTPLSGQRAKITLPYNFDILPLIPHPVANRLSKVASVGLSLGKLTFYGQGVSGKLDVTNGNNKFSRNVRWLTSGETKTLGFRIPSIQGSYLKIAVSKLIFHSNKMVLTPNLYISLKDVSLYDFVKIKLPSKFKSFQKKIDKKFVGTYGVKGKIPLSRLGSLRFDLFDLKIGTLHIPSRFSYSTSGTSLVSSAVYDFSMDVNKIVPDNDQSTLTNINSNDQLYNIKLQNLGGRSDNIELSVQGLPTGYTATFDKEPAKYDISLVPIDVILVVSPPEHIFDPPSTKFFSIIARSKAKTDLNLPNPTIIKNPSLIIPEIVDIGFNLENDQSDIIQVTPDERITVKFFGENFGNLNDTFTVNATLFTDVENRSWIQDFSVDPYNSGNHYFNGEFGFTFNRDDIFPSPSLYSLEIQATSKRQPSITKRYTQFLNFTEYFDIEASITPNNSIIFANWEQNFTLSLKNLGNVIDNFTLSSIGLDGYLYYPELVTISPDETEEVIITLRITDPDDLPEQNYPFRITATSGGSNSVYAICDANIKVLNPDYVPPGIDYLEPLFISSDLIYPQSSLTLGPSWRAVDEYPASVTTYINGSIYEDINWFNDSIIQIPVTGANPLSNGIYNLTILFSDISGNIARDQVWATVTEVDTINPSIIHTIDELTLPSNFAFTQTLTWNCTDINPYNVTIFRNGEIIPLIGHNIQQEEDEISQWQVIIDIEPGTLTEGNWNYSIFVQDKSNNFATSTISVDILSPDVIVPQFITWPVTEGIQDHEDFISIVANDQYPKYFQLWINSVLMRNDTWQAGIPLAFAIDDLNLTIGENNFEIYIFDEINYSNYYSWMFTYRDIITPSILIEPENFRVFEHNISTTITSYWQLYDKNPANYSIYIDDAFYISGGWSLGDNTVEVPIANLSAGIYQFEAYFNDTSGNIIYSSVIVTFEDVLEPYIWPLAPIQFEPLHTPDWIEFSISELHPSSYILLQNGIEIVNDELTSDYPLVFLSFEDLIPGTYNFTLKVIDESENVGTKSVLVEVTDFVPPLIKKPPDLVYSEGSIGNSLVWEITEANPHNYSIYRDNILLESGLLSQPNISLQIDGLLQGVYKYIFIAYDELGLSHSCINYVTVVDITKPTITNIGDCQFVTGDSNTKLQWTVYDLHPANLKLKRNENIIRAESWSNGEISLSLIGWSIGNHSVVIEVSDISGNVATDEVLVRIVESEPIEQQSKIGTAPGFNFEILLFCFLLIVPISKIFLGHKTFKKKK